ncbi:MAG: putative signal peptide protein [Pseudomonadota bacterium]|jgi:hypothetical protein
MGVLRHFTPILTRVAPNAGSGRWLKTRGAHRPGAITPAATPINGAVGLAYSAGPYTAPGGAPGVYTWSLSSGTLPPGLALSASPAPLCMITGTPTQAGAFPYTLRAANAYGASEQAYTITIV